MAGSEEAHGGASTIGHMCALFQSGPRVQHVSPVLSCDTHAACPACLSQPPEVCYHGAVTLTLPGI